MAAALAVAAPALAQDALVGSDTVFFETKIGSFKLIGSPEVPVRGTLTINFSGTVLISELRGTITPVGNIRREYQNDKFKKVGYFGKGKLIVQGTMRSVQFFGRDLTGSFKGVGLMRLYGEFDKDLKTGFYWYDPSEKFAWGNGGMMAVVPQRLSTPRELPKVRDSN